MMNRRRNVVSLHATEDDALFAPCNSFNGNSSREFNLHDDNDGETHNRGCFKSPCQSYYCYCCCCTPLKKISSICFTAKPTTASRSNSSRSGSVLLCLAKMFVFIFLMTMVIYVSITLTMASVKHRKKQHAIRTFVNQHSLVRVYPVIGSDSPVSQLSSSSQLEYVIDTLCIAPSANYDYNRPLQTEPKKRIPKDEGGFVLIPLVKTGATTARFVQLRVAEQLAKRKMEILQERESEHDNNNNNNNKIDATNNKHDSSLTITATATSNGSSNNNSTHDICQVRTFRHAHAREVLYARKYYKLKKSKRSTSIFVWTMLREPTARLLSWYWYRRASMFDVTPNVNDFVQNFIDPLSTHSTKDALHDHYIARLSYQLPPWRRSDHWNEKLAETYIHDIVDSYDFIGISERFDESMVVYGLLLNLPIGDLLYLQDHKVAGNHETLVYEDYNYNNDNAEDTDTTTDMVNTDTLRCRYIQPVDMDSDLSKFVYSSPQVQQDLLIWDNLLYKHANASLDETIDAFGRDRINKRVKLYQQARAMVQNECAQYVHDPCSNNNNNNNTTLVDARMKTDQCSLHKDWRCGQDCIDGLSIQNGWDDV